MAEPTTMEEWLLTRPAVVQALAHEFPANRHVILDDLHYVVIGWTESDEVILGPVHDEPFDYDVAVAGKVYVCAAHLREASHG